jgi:hypothetical protein
MKNNKKPVIKTGFFNILYMIYILEFTGKLYDFKKSAGKSSQMLKSISDNFTDTMILHRYELYFRCHKKFQTNDPDKIDLSKLHGKGVMLYHLDIYSGCSEKIVTLIEHCIENDIDLFVPVSDGEPHRYIREDDREKNPHRYEIRDILERYEHVAYDFSNVSGKDDLELKRIEMIRDLNIRSILG